jgi:hypothetical protein
VWHASGCGRDIFASLRLAKAALRGVGDARLGEWVERGGNGIYHVRRRLSAEEQAVVGEARDIRGTGEERERLTELFRAFSPEDGRRLSRMFAAAAHSPAPRPPRES